MLDTPNVGKERRPAEKFGNRDADTHHLARYCLYRQDVKWL